jgi:hypothetical protein
MLDRLGLYKGEEFLIPKHIHLFRTTLLKFGGGQDLSLFAPPPLHFDSTAKAIGIRKERHPQLIKKKEKKTLRPSFNGQCPMGLVTLTLGNVNQSTRPILTKKLSYCDTDFRRSPRLFN